MKKEKPKELSMKNPEPEKTGQILREKLQPIFEYLAKEISNAGEFSDIAIKEIGEIYVGHVVTIMASEKSLELYNNINKLKVDVSAYRSRGGTLCDIMMKLNDLCNNGDAQK